MMNSSKLVCIIFVHLKNYKELSFKLTLTFNLCIQAFGGDDSDVGSPRDNNAPAESSNLPVDPVQIGDPGVQVMEQQGKQKKGNENSITETEVSSVLPAGESYRSMGEILSSMDPGQPLSVSALESSAEKTVGKVTSSNLSAKRSAFWGRNNVSCHILFILTFTP